MQYMTIIAHSGLLHVHVRNIALLCMKACAIDLLCSVPVCRLTDDVARENWEKYGNPDGPQAATFGIALPSWIVSEENSIWLLVLYIGVFVFGLPVIVVRAPVLARVYVDKNSLRTSSSLMGLLEQALG